MAGQDKNAGKMNKVDRNGMIVGIVVGLLGFEFLGPEKTEAGFSITRVLYSALVSGPTALIGVLIARKIAGNKSD